MLYLFPSCEVELKVPMVLLAAVGQPLVSSLSVGWTYPLNMDPKPIQHKIIAEIRRLSTALYGMKSIRYTV